MSPRTRQLNAGLLFLAFILIIAGAATGSLFIAFFGVLFLVGGIFPSKRRTRIPQGQPPPAPPARLTPPIKQAEKAPELQVPIPQVRMTQPGPSPANAPLFPYTIFPTLNPIQPIKYEVAPEAKKGEAPDEFLSLVALMGLLRLLSRRS